MTDKSENRGENSHVLVARIEKRPAGPGARSPTQDCMSASMVDMHTYVHGAVQCSGAQ